MVEWLKKGPQLSTQVTTAFLQSSILLKYLMNRRAEFVPLVGGRRRRLQLTSPFD